MSCSNKLKRVAVWNLAAALLTLIFSLVYEHFSFGVWSNSMVFAFLVPLFGGALPFFLLSRVKGLNIPTCSIQMWCASLAWITVGMLVNGVIEIYGTTNSLIVVYAIIAVVLAAATLLGLVFAMNKKGRKRSS